MKYHIHGWYTAAAHDSEPDQTPVATPIESPLHSSSLYGYPLFILAWCCMLSM